MSEFINTIDVLGDDVVFEKLISRTLTEFKDNVLTIVGRGSFYQNKSITSMVLPSVIRIDKYSIYQCTALTMLDLSSKVNIDANAFSYSSVLTNVILRSTTMCTLSNQSAFDGTAIKTGTGYIYVPSSLVDSYKSASNWSTYANQFRVLEDYTVDGTITGELDTTKI